ncbi:MlaE family ABC transporter permease [Parapusillimonas granuli]|uniref:ABC transporter permease n=1 Tax=Parapusillimonas granuli TaxID=380911 RepID=A0A853FSB7_9BURK|nr:ABC transporter permease [Parapusillimonas granuli]MBB5214847.1 phospholipid/cholesterol/gamma-HCH transport system permease protein [Parapusillimonas granuli]MEB2397905.1 ABC transporter permease [Alcaligenaceae bacterium]NYT48745.1 ABC transporter permease [Parapusillimonas granuli]
MTGEDGQIFLRYDDAPEARLILLGDWTLRNYVKIGDAIASLKSRLPAPDEGRALPVDVSALHALDTSGAARLLELLGPDAAAAVARPGSGLPRERSALLRTVIDATTAAGQVPERRALPAFVELLGRIGLAMEQLWRQTLALLGFIGLTLQSLVLNLPRPRRWRVTSIVAQIEETGFNAVPIVALLTFMVGAVIAFLGATILADFGASGYTVNLVAFSFLREFAVLLTAILIAGRTASAFTAQLGSMKANEEIDALRTMGMSPIEVLVLPRILALLVSLPLLTFVGMVSGILGGLLVCALSLDISPTMFFTILKDDIPLRHFLLGMAKAPLFAYLIAVIGCQEGFKVSGSAKSVGEHTTSSVVQSIFIVILLDALAALFYMEMGW